MSSKTIRITGVDADGNFATEDVTLSGTTPVVSKTIWREVAGRPRVLGETRGNTGSITIPDTAFAHFDDVVRAGLGLVQIGRATTTPELDEIEYGPDWPYDENEGGDS